MKLVSPKRVPLPIPKLSVRGTWAAAQSIGYLMQQAVENPNVISLAAGLVDQKTLPVAETRRALDYLLEDENRGTQVLQYGTTSGALYLREQLVEYLARSEDCSPTELGIDCDDIVLTTGSQQFLSLIAEILLDPDDICIVAAPTYFVFLGTLNGVGARAVSIPIDQEGINTDGLQNTLARLESLGELQRVKLIYIVSEFDNPSGISLSNQRRADVVKIARQWSKHNRIYVLEDSAYRELRYDGRKQPSLWSFDDTRETVILAQTFSKSFSPGLRVGFGVLPQALCEPVCNRKSNEDFGSANFNQHLIATVLDQGLFDTHVQQLRKSYREKRDCMLEAADKYFGDLAGISWVRPSGGLYVWMSLPDGIGTGFSSQLFDIATQREQVMYVPGELFYASESPESPRNHMRLSFGVQSVEGIEDGMRRLARAVRSLV